jgi:hypothetical protein
MSGTTPPKPHVHFSLMHDAFSTGDEVPYMHPFSEAKYDRIDPINAPYESSKIFYRPRGAFVRAFPET